MNRKREINSAAVRINVKFCRISLIWNLQEQDGSSQNDVIDDRLQVLTNQKIEYKHH